MASKLHDMLANLQSSYSSPSEVAVHPSTGLCIKWKSVTHEGVVKKLFVNLCTIDDCVLPLPDMAVDEAGLTRIIQSQASSAVSAVQPFVVPFSLSPIRPMSTERGGDSCIVVDCLLRKEYFTRRVLGSELFKGYTVLVVCEGLKARYHLDVDPTAYVILQNKKVYGTLVTQYIAKQPMVQEVIDQSPKSTKTSTNKQPSVPRPKPIVDDLQTVALAKKAAGLSAANYRMSQRFDEFRLIISDLSQSHLSPPAIQLHVHATRVIVRIADELAVDVALPLAIDRDSAAIQIFEERGEIEITARIV